MKTSYAQYSKDHACTIPEAIAAVRSLVVSGELVFDSVEDRQTWWRYTGKKAITRTCERCNAPITGQKNKKFCDRTCQSSKDVTAICAGCDKPFSYVKYAENKRKYCCHACEVAHKKKNMDGRQSFGEMSTR